MKSHAAAEESRIGIYVRESRDDNEKNIETIETQRDLLLEYVARNGLGIIIAIYMDDNVSGSSFDRDGINRLKVDVEAKRLDIVLVKDLSRLGRSNSKTLLFLDFLEENGVRVITYDNRYDSKRDDDMVGIETWANERYVRDISRKIRASLRFKIEKGEYIGHAPYGYRKSQTVKNTLEVDPENAEKVRRIFMLYRQGYGYSSIAHLLNDRGILPPLSSKWSGTAIRRILCNSVYTGETVQGISEKISFKSRKTRRLPPEKRVVTADTHEAIIGREEFLEVQKLRQTRKSFSGPHKKEIHILRGIMYCGRCGSAMYARKRAGSGLAYVCGNYFRNGSSACSSHLVFEKLVVDEILQELGRIAALPGMPELAALEVDKHYSKGGSYATKLKTLESQLLQKKKQKELVYMDRLEGRIEIQLFEKISRSIDERISSLEDELSGLNIEKDESCGSHVPMVSILGEADRKYVTNELVRCMIERILVFDNGDECSLLTDGIDIMVPQNGLIVIEFKYSEV